MSQKNGSKPVPEDIIASLKAIRPDNSDALEFNKQLQNATAEEVELNGRLRFFKLRDRWSTWLIIWISFLTFINALVVLLLGYHYINFGGAYEWEVLDGILIANYIEMLGMGAIVVTFLFKK